MRFYSVFLFLVLSFTLASAQSSFLILDKEENLMYENYLVNTIDTFHSSIYPRMLSSVTNYDSIQSTLQVQSSSPFSNHLRNEYPIELFKQSTQVTPLINISNDFLNPSSSAYTLGTGLLLHSNIGKKVSIHTAVYGALERFGIEEQRAIDSTHILPHIGEYNANINGAYSYTNWQAYITYQPYRFINFQAGKQYNFLGDGYRSLLLSDNSSPYPFIKATVTAGKIQYLILYQFLQDMDTRFATYPNEKKYSTSHYLSWNIGKRFNLNLFETVIWRDELEPGVHRGYDFNYMNPVIFFRPIEFSIGSPDNVIMGGGYRLRLFKKTNLYGQLVLDEFKLKEMKSESGWWGNKYGYQLGLKIYDLFKISNLFVLGEYNTVKPFTYSHWSSMENYGNMHQALAHPLGSNFKEIIGLINYRKNRWQFQAKLSLAKVGIDKDTINYGQNIYRSYDDNRQEYNNYTLQGELTQITKAEVKTTYIVNPLWNLRLEAGIRIYSYSNSIETLKENQLFLTLKTLF